MLDNHNNNSDNYNGYGTNKNRLNVSMVSTEYLPMHVGVGRYTYNLANHLQQSNDLDVAAVSDIQGQITIREFPPITKTTQKFYLNW